uniref:Uncharacterized protein n=1 Tax=viral metagenome TaxID=1070528 RepID=A0A6C0JVM3_9ZZZZ
MDVLPNTNPTFMMINKKLYMLIVALVLIGGINWLVIGTTGLDLVKNFLGRRTASVVYIIVGVSALLLALRRDVYLPFLGQTLFPAEALTLKTPQGANESVTIRTKPGARVVYWAAEPDMHADGKGLKYWNEAYKNLENSGVVKADDQGVATLRIRGAPQPYRVGFFMTLKPHVHFRVEGANGFFGPVKTKFIESGSVDSFANAL